MIRRRLAASGFLALLSVLGGGATAVAATPPTQSVPAISMTPAIQDRVLGALETSTTFSVDIANQSDRPMTLSLRTNDFKALNEVGGLSFLESDPTRVTKGNGLSSAIKLDKQIISLPANSSQKVTAQINDVKLLAPGGHYTAIIAQVLADGTQNSSNRVAINQAVSSLIFLETAGSGTKTLQLLRPEFPRLSFALPSDVNLVFKATGNTQTIPRGIVTLTRGNSIVQRGIINDNSSLLLPDSTRLLQTKLSGQRRPLLSGFYTLRVEYRYEGSLGITTYEQRVLYINVPVITLAMSIVGLVAYVAIIGHKTWRHHLKKMLNKLSDISHIKK